MHDMLIDHAAAYVSSYTCALSACVAHFVGIMLISVIMRYSQCRKVA